ncbi:hypothetical protein ACV3HO_005527 [Pseudomonas aeruginosa]
MQTTVKSAAEIEVGPFRYTERAFLATLLCLAIGALALASMLGSHPTSDATWGTRMLSVQMIAAYLIVPIISVGGFLCHRAGSKALAGMLPLIGAGFLAGALGASLI